MPEHTIAENLQRLITARTAIGNAITAKGGTVTSGDGFEEFPADIATIPSGGGSTEHNDVNFYDYGGTIVDSYSASDFAKLTELPNNPTPEGLTAQGWNWTLAAAKTYVADYGKLNIGQMYNTSDGKTRIHITLHDGRLEPYLGLGINGSVDVDWGDGSAHDTMVGSSLSTPVFQSHKFAAEGDYVIELAVTGKIAFLYNSTKGTLLLTGNQLSTNGNAVYRNAISKINVGNSVTSIGGYAFYNCNSLTSITIPSGVTSIGSYAFSGCYSLTSITIPSGVTSISNNAFQSCNSLASITIPSGVTSIGGSAFSGCYGYSYVKFLGTTTIPTIPNVNAWAGIPTDCYILAPFDYLDEYLNTTNMPDDSTYLYLCYAIYADGETLPTTDKNGYTLTWYATREDAREETNPITVGNGKEIYARGVEP